jgi:hypothetical protein
VPSAIHSSESSRPEKEWATSGRRPATVYGSRDARAGFNPCPRFTLRPTLAHLRVALARKRSGAVVCLIDREETTMETTRRAEPDFEQLPALIGCWYRTVKMAVKYRRPGPAFDAARELAHLGARYLDLKQPSLFDWGR